MKTVLMIVSILLCLNFCLLGRTIIWSEFIAKEYMVALEMQSECDKEVLYENRLPLIESRIGILYFKANYNPNKCDGSEKQWDKYEKYHSLYAGHHWLTLLKEMYNR